MVDEDQLFEVQVIDESPVAVRLALKGDLDLASAPQLDAHVAALRPFAAPLVLDVSRLEFIDSSGLRALTAARRAAVDDVGAAVQLVGCRRSLNTLLEMTGLQDAFERV